MQPDRGAAVFVANREHAGGDRGGHRLAVAGRHEPRGGAGWRAGAVIGDADENRVEQLPFAGRRQPAAMQEKDRLDEPVRRASATGRRIRAARCRFRRP